MTNAAEVGPRYYANTGDLTYDAVGFTGQPQAQLLSRTSRSISIVRHLGVRRDGLASSAVEPTGVDVLLLNSSSGGRYRGSVGEQRIDRPLRKGDLSFVPGDCAVDIEFPASNSAFVMTLPRTLLRGLAADIGAGPLAPMHSERNDRLAQLFVMIEHETTAPGFASDLMIDGLLRAMVTILARRGPGGEMAPVRLHLSPVKLRRTTDFIEAELDRSVGLDEIAAVAGLSPFHFSRVFKLATGETPYQYLGSRRLARARQLLDSGRTPLAEIALACGFASQSHFTAAFTKGVGVSPGRYRRQVQLGR